MSIRPPFLFVQHSFCCDSTNVYIYLFFIETWILLDLNVSLPTGYQRPVSSSASLDCSMLTVRDSVGWPARTHDQGAILPSHNDRLLENRGWETLSWRHAPINTAPNLAFLVTPPLPVLERPEERLKRPGYHVSLPVNCRIVCNI